MPKALIQKELVPKEEVKIAVLEVQMGNITKSVDNLSSKIEALTTKIDDNYIKKEDFNPVKAEVEKLKYWQAKTIGYAAGAAAVIDIFLRYVFKT